MPSTDAYDAELAAGRVIYNGLRIGRPGHGWAYWPLFVAAQPLRLHWDIDVSGRDHVGPGPAILIGNHVSAFDPVMVGISSTWHLSFFTKVEAFEGRGSLFFRATGQIPLRRGDEAATNWALRMSAQILALGHMVCVYPEGTRSPDGRSLHRLHRRVLVPVLQANPDVPVHAMTTTYDGRRRGRQHVDLRFSPRLDLDVRTMSANDLTATVRDALLDLGGMPYVDAFGRAVKSPRGSAAT